MGRRGRRELRAEGDEGLRARLRHARRGQARPRDDQRVPERPDRSAQGLSRLRRPGFGARRATTRSPAGPTASPSGRSARSPIRSRRATSRPRSPPACSTAGAPARACTSTSRRSRPRTGRSSPWLLDYEVDGVIRLRDGNRHRARVLARRVPVRRRGRRRRPVGRDRVLDRRRARRGSRARSSGATTSRRWTRDRCTRADGRPRQLQAAGIEAVPVEDFGDLHDDPQLAHRGHFEPPHAPVPRRQPLRAQRLPPVGRAGRLRPGRPTLGQDSEWVLRDVLGLQPGRDRGTPGGRCRRVRSPVKVRRRPTTTERGSR